MICAPSCQMSDTFISYARRDGDRVERLADFLRASGFDVWWGGDGVPSQFAYGQLVAGRLRGSQVTTENRMARTPARMLVHTVAIIVIATVLAAVAASGAVAQTQPSPTAAPNALPRSFPPPDVAKTAPVKQGKSCSSYGDGFVNVPGTDTCVKAGGYVRTDAASNR